MIRDQVETQLTLALRRDFLNYTMLTEGMWIQSMSNGDGLFRAKLSYQWRDGLRVCTGGDHFYGTERGLFGQFDKRDRAVLGMSRDF